MNSLFKVVSLGNPNSVFSKKPEMIELLFAGTYCTVHKVKIDDTYYALRILEPCSSTTEAMERNGADIHASFSNSTNKLAQEVILKLYWYSKDPTKPLEQLLELIPSIKGLESSDLRSALSPSSTDSYDGKLHKTNQFTCILSCLKMLKVLHDRKIFHLDIKPENIAVMVDNNNKLSIKLFDFGFSVSNKQKSKYHICGTHGYLNPNAKTGFEKDHFAMAITILEIASLGSLVNTIYEDCYEYRWERRFNQQVQLRTFNDSNFVDQIKKVVNPPPYMEPGEKMYLQKFIDEYADFREENPLIDAIINDLLVGSTPTLSGELYNEYCNPLNRGKLMFIINGKSSRKVSLSRTLRKFRKDQIQETENQAAITIQKVARGYQQRQHLKKNPAAITIQKVMRGHQKKTRFQLQQRSAKTIQKTYRDYISRKKKKSICNFTQPLTCTTF